MSRKKIGDKWKKNGIHRELLKIKDIVSEGIENTVCLTMPWIIPRERVISDESC